MADELKMIAESKLIYPNPKRAEKTNAGSVDNFNDLLRKSWENPAGFWADVAGELSWFKPWEKTMEGELPNFRFFVGGISNPCYNMLDRNIAKGYGNKLALIWEGEDYSTKFYTYNMLLAEVNKFANVLKKFGLQKGDGVAIFLPNLAETVIAVLACYRLGILFNTVFSGFSVSALKDRLTSYEPRIVITADASYRRGKTVPLKDKADQAMQGVDSVEAVVVVKRAGIEVDMQPGRDYWWDEVIQRESVLCEPEPLEANEAGLVFYTSGTTGKPKGIVHSGTAFIVNNYVYAKYHMDHHPDDMFWCTADIGWLTMHIWGIAGALTNGVTTIFYEGALDYPNADRVYEMIHKYRVNKLFTAPTAVRMLMRFGEDRMKNYDLSCLEVISLVGEPFGPEAWQWAYEKLGNKQVCINNTWGQTETAGCPLAGAAWLTPMKPGSCGIQFLGAEMDVVDDQGNSLPPNVPGNLVMKRPIPMLVRTLWKEPQRYFDEYFSQIPGCYFANDAAIKDQDGHFWVTGRLDDVFNVAGHRLSTMEMESAVAKVDEVAEAAVIGVADEIKGLVPVVFATLRQGIEPSAALEQKIKASVADNIGKIAVPARIYFTQVMPKTASGKIMRRLLKETLEEGQVKGDITGLEDVGSLEEIKKVVAAQEKQ